MRKLINFIVLGACFLGLSLWVAPLPTAQAAVQENPYGTFQGKRCEKCKRGPDGKMVCEPVPCPN